MNRKERTISETIEKLMVDQIARELYNHNVYRTYANYYYVRGLFKLYLYYEMRSNEEYNHHQWIVDRLYRAGVDFNYPEVPAVKANHVILKPEDSFQKVVDLEIETTMYINKMIETAKEEKDWQTEGWLKRTLNEEQMEEEDISRTIQAMAEEDTDWQTKEDTILSYYNNLNRVTEGDRDVIDNSSFLKQR